MAVGSAILLTLASAVAEPAASYARAATCGEADPIELDAAPAEATEDPEGHGSACSEPPSPSLSAPVVDCHGNDAAARIWVQEMVGVCDMPRPTLPETAWVHAAPRPSSRPPRSAMCIGAGCAIDPPPLSSLSQPPDRAPWLTERWDSRDPSPRRNARPPVPVQHPRDPDPGRIDRPPRAAA